MKRLQNLFRQHFSPRLARLGTNGATALSGGNSKNALVLVGRQHCVFLHLDAERVPTKQRSTFLMTAVRRAAPFADPEFHPFWSGGQVSAWIWSRARVRQIAGEAYESARFVAESAYFDSPERQGLSVVALPEGYESRVWRAGSLIASRWQENPPTKSERIELLRMAGVMPSSEPTDHTDQPHIAPMLDTPWTQRPTALSMTGLQPIAGRLLVPLSLVACLAFAWQVGGLLRAQFELFVVERRMAETSELHARILDARESAEVAMQKAEILLALRPNASQLELLAQASAAMTDRNWSLVNWNQTTPEVLEVVIASESLDVESIVSTWEASPVFADVTPTLDRSGRNLTLKMRIGREPGETP